MKFHIRLFSLFVLLNFGALYPDLILKTSTKFKPESFYAENVSLLNNDRKNIDSVFYNRHTLDFRVSLQDSNDAVTGNFVIRNKAVWGAPAGVASTTDSDVKFLEAVVGPHRHHIPRMIVWMREAWLDIACAELIGHRPKYPVHVKFGAFPFSLGRGISLGDAYAVGPETLGFYSNNIVDQFAFGVDVYGGVLSGADYDISYDLYGAILENKSGSTSEVAARILGQQFGRRSTPERRFGVINFVVAGRLQGTYQFKDHGTLTLEPYALYNRDPEQFVEFPGDARARLATLGFALEYESSRFECGFDGAFNLGNQFVKGWDRNQVILKNINGTAQVANSSALVLNSQDTVLGNAPYLVNNDRQNVIFNTFQDASQNGATIISNITDNYGPFFGTVLNPLHVINSQNRFRNPYTNVFKGWMFVSDAAVIIKEGWKVAATVGVASGDDNPNFDTKDGNFKGFIPLQEIYAGKRVRTAFLLNGSGKVARPITIPSEDLDGDPKLSLEVSGFTNLVFIGSSMLFEGMIRNKVWYSIQPDVLGYWQQRAVPKGVQTYLGTEFNVFADFYLTDTMKIFGVGSIFFPGALFKDISGKPGFTPEAVEELDSEDVTGFLAEPVPGLGHNTAFSVNIGVEYSF